MCFHKELDWNSGSRIVVSDVFANGLTFHLFDALKKNCFAEVVEESQDLSGVYSDEEMAYADAEAENNPVTPEVLPPKKDYAKEKEEKDAALEELKALCSKATKGLKKEDKAKWMKEVLKVSSFDEIEKLNKDLS